MERGSQVFERGKVQEEMTKKMNPVIEQYRRALRKRDRRLKKICEILEMRDNQLLAADGPVPQDPPFLKRIYLLAKGRKER